MDVADALGLQPTTAVPPSMLCKVDVEAVEVSSVQCLERNVAERRENIGLGVNAIGRPGGWPDGGARGQQPLLSEEGTQRQSGRLHEGAGSQGGLGLVERGLRLPLASEPTLG
jgi:hypothetical protein